ncbi:MAG TPA: DNA repair exonuclease [Castellaniella sp.]|jgi:DNA repair exonuclease SbcCD nuclease subunit|nr:DNA repair exonuclease [Castellaniella sp.]
MTLRVLHTADWQMGRQYGRFAPEDAGVLAEARFSTVERVAALAAEKGADAVLVAGDVFDAQTVSDRTIRRVFNALEGFSGPWIMIPGNHDAALAESVWTRARRLGAVPDHVHVLLEPVVREFPDLGFAVLAAPLTQRHTHEDLTAWFDGAETARDLLRIGLAHGGVQGILAEDIDFSNPIATDRAARARLDYLALGDWHGMKQVDARTWYSGTPEHERFKDNGAGQVLWVDFTEPGQPPEVTPQAVSQYRWLAWQEDLSVASDLDPLLQRLERLAPEVVLSLTVSGRIDLAGNLRLQQALSVAHGQCRSLQCDASALRLMPTDEDVAALRADGYLSDVIADLRERQGSDDAASAETAREALVLMAELLRERVDGGDPA